MMPWIAIRPVTATAKDAIFYGCQCLTVSTVYELNRFYFWRVTCEQNTCDLSHTHTQKEKQNRPHHKNTNTHAYSRPIENKSLVNCNRSIICSAFYFRCQSVLQLAKKSKPSWFHLNHHNFYLWSGIVVIICSASLVVFVYCCCCFS